VIQNDFLLAVPTDAATGIQRQHAKKAHDGGTMANLNVTNGPAPLYDRIEEVGPELFDVLLVWFVELGWLMQDRFVFVRRIKRPACLPGLVEGAFRPIKVAADIFAFLCFIACVGAMLP